MTHTWYEVNDLILKRKSQLIAPRYWPDAVYRRFRARGMNVYRTDSPNYDFSDHLVDHFKVMGDDDDVIDRVIGPWRLDDEFWQRWSGISPQQAIECHRLMIDPDYVRELGPLGEAMSSSAISMFRYEGIDPEKLLLSAPIFSNKLQEAFISNTHYRIREDLCSEIKTMLTSPQCDLIDLCTIQANSDSLLGGVVTARVFADVLGDDLRHYLDDLSLTRRSLVKVTEMVTYGSTYHWDSVRFRSICRDLVKTDQDAEYMYEWFLAIDDIPGAHESNIIKFFDDRIPMQWIASMLSDNG